MKASAKYSIRTTIKSNDHPLTLARYLQELYDRGNIEGEFKIHAGSGTLTIAFERNYWEDFEYLCSHMKVCATPGAAAMKQLLMEIDWSIGTRDVPHQRELFAIAEQLERGRAIVKFPERVTLPFAKYDPYQRPKSHPGSKRWSVAWYIEDRAYGGPEEGGWYYNCGWPRKPGHIPRYASKTRWFKSEEQARAYRNRLVTRYQEVANEGRASISSVLSEGRYAPYVQQGKPLAYPETIPHYE